MDKLVEEAFVVLEFAYGSRGAEFPAAAHNAIDDPAAQTTRKLPPITSVAVCEPDIVYARGRIAARVAP
jgi:hypothetical protein